MENKAFTLIELLVVVLIIGILAAVAVPQYQKAVIKSRYAMLLPLTSRIVESQEMYYFANNEYATTFAELDVDMPGGKLDTSTDTLYKYDWGNCKLSERMVTCTSELGKVAYQVHFRHEPAEPGVRNCVSRTTDMNDAQNKFCKAETGALHTSGGSIEKGYWVWKYQ